MFKKIRNIILLFLFLIIVVIFSVRTMLQQEYRNLSSIISEHNIFNLSFANEDSEQISFHSDSLLIKGDLFYSEKSKPSPCILILHGTHTLGRKQPVILTLAKEFQKLDYSVMTIDFRGYNESQDPSSINTVKDLDFAQDVISAIDYLYANPLIDSNRIFILGHSFGAGVALSTISRESRIKRFVLFGAPRRVRERIFDIASPERQQLLRKNISNMLLSYEVDSTILLQSIKSRDIEDYIQIINNPNHQAKYYLIDGDKEDPKDLKFYKNVSEKISINTKYYTVKGSNHYLNTGFLFGKPAYDSKLVKDFVTHVDEWLRN